MVFQGQSEEGDSGTFGEEAARARESRHSTPISPLLWLGPAGSSTTAENADRAALYDFRPFPAGILAPSSPLGQQDLGGSWSRGPWRSSRRPTDTARTTDPWLAGMLARKPKKVVAVALANRTARSVWAVATRKEDYRVRTAA